MSASPSSIYRFQVETHSGMDTEPAGRLCSGFSVLNCGQSNFCYELWTECFTLFTCCQNLNNFDLTYSMSHCPVSGDQRLLLSACQESLQCKVPTKLKGNNLIMDIIKNYSNSKNLIVIAMRSINSSLKTINGLVLLIIFIAVFLQIILRFTAKFTGFMLPWTEDLSRYGLVILTFIGSAIATLTNENIKISSFRKRIKPSISRWLEIIENSLLLFISIILSYGNFITAQKMIKSPAGALFDFIKIGHIYYIVFFSMVILALYSLFNLYMLLKKI